MPKKKSHVVRENWKEGFIICPSPCLKKSD